MADRPWSRAGDGRGTVKRDGRGIRGRLGGMIASYESDDSEIRLC